jgi:hypothetical protein
LIPGRGWLTLRVDHRFDDFLEIQLQSAVDAFSES